jgi:F0F1-type ATP synthase membrane subunit c/vacuolar-type H+-ATPase subunit K
MGIPILPILKAIGPLIAASSGIVSSLDRGGQSRNMATEDRVRKLEDELLRMSQVLASSVEQLQAAAEALRIQSEQNEAREARLRHVTMAAVVAGTLSLIALVVAFAT